jgi:hypothetical protein
VARLGLRLENRRVLSLMLRSSGWEPVTPPDFASGILLMKTTPDEAWDIAPDRLQSAFRRHGVALTGFPGGIVRASPRIFRGAVPGWVRCSQRSVARVSNWEVESQARAEHWPVGSSRGRKDYLDTRRFTLKHVVDLMFEARPLASPSFLRLCPNVSLSLR